MIFESKLTLQQAVQKIYGDSLKPTKTSPIQWGSFTPYTHPYINQNKALYFKLIKISSQLQTSKQIIANIKKSLGNLIHNVQIYQIQRNYDDWYYLLKSEENLISLQSYIQIKRKARQVIQESFVIRFLEFVSKLESSPLSSCISFKIDEIGIDENYNFYLTNYQIYFRSALTLANKSTITKQNQNTLNYDLRCVFCKLLTPHNQKFDLIQLYSYVQQNYSQNIFNLVDKCINNLQFKASSIFSTQYSQPYSFSGPQSQNIVLQTTLTDSFGSGQPVQQDSNASISNTITLQQPLITSNNSAKPKKRTLKITILSISFIIILLIIGAVTLKYIHPKPLQCQTSQYQDTVQNICLPCDESCQTCSNSGDSSCLSCKDKFFIIKASVSQSNGKCSINCPGQRFQANICIVPHH